MIDGMNHFTVLAEDERATLDFYVGLLGLTVGPRPDLGFPGAWLQADPAAPAVLHIIFGRTLPAPRAGVIDHMAFSASGLREAKARFDASGNQINPNFGTAIGIASPTRPPRVIQLSVRLNF